MILFFSMKKYIYKINCITVASLVVISLLSSCTKKFEEFNNNPYGVSDQELDPDGALIVVDVVEGVCIQVCTLCLFSRSFE